MVDRYWRPAVKETAPNNAIDTGSEKPNEFPVEEVIFSSDALQLIFNLHGELLFNDSYFDVMNLFSFEERSLHSAKLSLQDPWTRSDESDP